MWFCVMGEVRTGMLELRNAAKIVGGIFLGFYIDWKMKAGNFPALVRVRA